MAHAVSLITPLGPPALVARSSEASYSKRRTWIWSGNESDAQWAGVAVSRRGRREHKQQHKQHGAGTLARTLRAHAARPAAIACCATRVGIKHQASMREGIKQTRLGIKHQARCRQPASCNPTSGAAARFGRLDPSATARSSPAQAGTAAGRMTVGRTHVPRPVREGLWSRLQLALNYREEEGGREGGRGTRHEAGRLPRGSSPCAGIFRM